MQLKAEGLNPVLLDSYTIRDYKADLLEVHPATGGAYSAQGQSFVVPSDGDYRITSAKFYVAKEGSPVGHVVAELYAMTGTFGSTAIPTGSALATSDLIDMEKLSTYPTMTLEEFTFPAAQQYVMRRGKHYCIEMENHDATVFGYYNHTKVGVDTQAIGEKPTHDGNANYYRAAGWTPFGAGVVDTTFYVYGKPVVGLFKGLFVGVIGKK